MIIWDKTIDGAGMSYANCINDDIVVKTTSREDMRLFQGIDIKYSFLELQEIANIIYNNRNIPLDDVFLSLQYKGYELIGENEVDIFMMWIKQIFSQKKIEL